MKKDNWPDMTTHAPCRFLATAASTAAPVYYASAVETG